MSKRKTTLIVQFQKAENNLDELFAFENSLAQGIEQSRSGILDGNDIGNTTYNIYVFPKSGRLGPCMENIKMWLKAKKLLEKTIIVRVTPSGKAIVDFPEGYEGEFDYGI